MTQPSSAQIIDNLTPADGVPTRASRLTGDRASDEFVYIRVTGSDLTTLEPQFYGADLSEAFLYGKQDVVGHDVYYRTKSIERKKFTIRKVSGREPGTELHDKRRKIFERNLPKRYVTRPPAAPRDWREIPDAYPQRKFLMKMGQERAHELRKIGFTDAQIDTAARKGTLSVLWLRDENGELLRKPDGSEITIQFHVHHCVPLKCGGSNTLDNFALVDDLVHQRIFHRGDDPAVSKLPEGTHAEVALTVPREGEDIISLFLNVEKISCRRAA